MSRRRAGRPVAKQQPLATVGATSAVPQPVPRVRKVHYEGYLKRVATKPEQLLARATAAAKGLGGYVERLVGRRLTVRVPVASFRALLDKITGLGEVLQRHISARDITEAYHAVELRLRLLQASRRRLTQLLAGARNEHEKLSLLAQISRLTEQIDQLEVSRQQLDSLAAFSRITVEAMPRPQEATALAQQELGVFRWIARLSPFARDVAKESHRLEIPVPEGMVELDHDDPVFGSVPWRARSADGVAIWTSARDNNPHGSSPFPWLNTVNLVDLYRDFADETK